MTGPGGGGYVAATDTVDGDVCAVLERGPHRACLGCGFRPWWPARSVDPDGFEGEPEYNGRATVHGLVHGAGGDVVGDCAGDHVGGVAVLGRVPRCELVESGKHA